MNNFVLDCSITMAWFFKDEASTYTNNILVSLASNKAYVPSIWKLEVANALLMAENKKRITQADVTQAFSELKSLPIESEKDESDPNTLIGLARQYKLSVYDATYLNLAIRKGMPLATKDDHLASAAKKCGVHLLSKL